MSLNFTNQQNGNGGFILLSEDKEIGRLTYTIQPEDHLLIISYVQVFPEFEGRGFGKKLVENAIEFARKNGWKIHPHCSYARSVMRRMPDISDVFNG